MNEDRKIAVFMYLTSGLTPLRDIYQLNCFVGQNGTRVSWKVFLRGMRKLAKDKYIKIIPCGYASEVYGPQAALLLPLGANFLCAQISHLDPADFRMTKPKPANVDHELKLTEIVNAIKYGVSQGWYALESISDDRQIRLWYKNRGVSLKGVYIADLKTVIKATRNDKSVASLGHHIEYENGNKGRSYWYPKLNCWQMNIILITRDAARAANLSEYIKTSKLSICIITHADFKKIGLLSCANALLRFQKSIYVSGQWQEIK